MFDTGLVNLGDWTICETQTCQWTDPKIRPSSNLVGGVQGSKSRTSNFVRYTFIRQFCKAGFLPVLRAH